MDFLAARNSDERFDAYVDGLAGVIGHADRGGPLKAYCAGLLLPGERKSVEPMAAVTAPARVAAQHQSLPHFVGQGPWSDETVLAKVRDLVLPAVERHGPIEAWIIDDTGFPEKGEHSVGVMRQYCGQLGKRENCQVAVSLSIANHGASLPVAWRLYLPDEWASDAERRKKASSCSVPCDRTSVGKRKARASTSRPSSSTGRLERWPARKARPVLTGRRPATIGGNDTIHVGFHRKTCAACASRPLCTRAKADPREITLRPRPLHEALQKVRRPQETDGWRDRYGKRAGIEGTLSQAARAFSLRRCRYLGLAKTKLQHVFTALAINVVRMDAWPTERPIAKTRRSAFTTLAPWVA